MALSMALLLVAVVPLLLLTLGPCSATVATVSAARQLSVLCFSQGTILRAIDNPLFDECRRRGSSSVLPVYFRDVAAADAFAQDLCAETERAGLQSLAHKIGGRIAIVEGHAEATWALSELLRSAREEGFGSMHVLYVNTSVAASPRLERVLAAAVQQSGHSELVAVRDDLFAGTSTAQISAEVSEINDLRLDRYTGRYARLDSSVVVPAASTPTMGDLSNVLTGPLRERAGAIGHISLLDGCATVSLLTGEDLAMSLISESVNTDEISFSYKYRHRYVDEFSTSAEHRRSLARLANASINSAYTNFFQGEVVGSYLSRFLAQGSLSPRLVLHARSLLAKSLARRLERPLVCRLRTEAVRKDWHSFVSRSALRLYGEDRPDLEWRYSYSRFKGHLTREAAMGPEPSPGQPWIVFVHGFGGSLEQSTQLAKALLRRNPRLRISALDLMGFGHSEKIPVSINQYFWRDQVVRFLETSTINSATADGQSSVILMGNSIGGFIAAAAASHLSETRNARVRCDGLVLCNSAGQINGGGLEDADIDALFPPYTGPAGELLRLFGRGVFSLLQPRIQQTCEWLYPTNPSPVRGGTAANILRDSCDIGAEDIIAAGGKLPKPEPFNSLLRKFEGRVLVAQGVLDPLNDARARAAQFGGIRSGITVDLLQAGHCPMEELPEEVADSILRWM